MVVTLPGCAENTHIVMPSNKLPISASSRTGGEGSENSRIRKRIAHTKTTGATHKDPNQFPAHHSCHSRRNCAPHNVLVKPKAPSTALAAAPSATAAKN